jgi:hypothetical protein
MIEVLPVCLSKVSRRGRSDAKDMSSPPGDFRGQTQNSSNKYYNASINANAIACTCVDESFRVVVLKMILESLTENREGTTNLNGQFAASSLPREVTSRQVQVQVQWQR